MGTNDKCLGIHPLTSNILEIMISVITIFELDKTIAKKRIYFSIVYYIKQCANN